MENGEKTFVLNMLQSADTINARSARTSRTHLGGTIRFEKLVDALGATILLILNVICV